MSYFVYVLESVSFPHKYYVGMSKDVSLRLKEHNRGKSKYTKSFMPWRLIYEEFAGDSIAARKLEKYYKSTAGKNKLRKKGVIQN